MKKYRYLRGNQRSPVEAVSVRLAVCDPVTPDVSGSQTPAMATAAAPDCSTTVTTAVQRLFGGPEEIGFKQN